MFLRKEHFTCYRTASRQRLCSPKLSSEIAWRLSEVLTSPFSSPLFKRLRLHVGFKSCVRVSEFSVDPENSDSLAADECDWTPSRRRDRLFPGSRTQHESSASVPPARFTWMYSFCFCTFSMKTLISHLTSDVKHSLHLTNSRFYRSLSILDMEIFWLFLCRWSTRTETRLTRQKINDSSLDLDSKDFDFDLTEEMMRWIIEFIWRFQ